MKGYDKQVTIFLVESLFIGEQSLRYLGQTACFDASVYIKRVESSNDQFPRKLLHQQSSFQSQHSEQDLSLHGYGQVQNTSKLIQLNFTDNYRHIF